jgi:hypothetical protein
MIFGLYTCFLNPTIFFLTGALLWRGRGVPLTRSAESKDQERAEK